ncbi:MAG: NeuD/PglB/VioB family sugar acetyltransferase [Candidatus Thiodiazotropha lotti]|uniref:NeuD/PglB/VioB family sugar acetyltransferase n=1 Tax=Candidatus Thiodiazotropha lotti TaxID=2792787 RepID=A0A9E4MZK2_9GAMM|nr:NeuD/PglB/VioB family sugar acetyltransferase [Candidatus Thiodiazotropha lotti]MCW4202060.1 NeuD/PglB/VioB family sugar acetyltransferase [Candidatus Thiodiazotropha lotti]
MSSQRSIKPMVIIGSGGHAFCLREIAALAGFNVIGAIDRTATDIQQVNGLPILGGDDLLLDSSFIQDHQFAVGIGNPVARNRYGDLLLRQGADCPPIINPSSYVSADASLGAGVLLMGMNAVNHGARLDDFVALDWQVTVGHGSHLGRAVFAGPGSRVAGDVECGKESYLGLGCQVIEKVSIGEHSVIGAGATVTRNIPANVVAVGSPAKVIKENPLNTDHSLGPKLSG